MRRIDRRRLERLRRRVITTGSSFALGALVATGLLARQADLNSARPADLTARRSLAEEPPAPVATTGYTASLQDKHLLMPVAGVKPSALRDTFDAARALGRVHDAIDIMAPRGTEVRAVEDGTIAKLFTSKAGGLTIYEFDPTQTFCYYYAHLDDYAPGLSEGQHVTRGQVLAYVGSTGNASPDAPHLHFAIARLGADRAWWKGDAINPYPVLAK